MIYVNITGGLGNQMFQYALARKYQIQTGQKIIFNIYEFSSLIVFMYISSYLLI